MAKSDENFGCYLIRTEQAEEIFKTLPIAEEVSVVDGEVGLVTKEIREKELQKILPYAISYMKLA